MKLHISLAVFTAMVVFAEAMLHNCKMLECPTNKTVTSSAAYTIRTTKTYYEPKKPVTVIVSAKQCPKGKKQPGPEWYKLQVVNSTGFPVNGKFVKPSQRSEDRACEKNSLIIFHTCEPMVMHDLPRKHVYRLQEDLGGEDICFRITLHNKGNNFCEVIKHCVKSKSRISMENITSTATPMTNGSNITTVDNSTNFKNETVHENKTTNPDESSGMIPETTSTPSEAKNKTINPDESSGMIPETTSTPSEPTKKPTEKRSTEIIDILIGSRRRRARCRKCSRVNSAAKRVCGTDGKTYDSECHLEREECLTGKTINFHYSGRCREKPPTQCELGTHTRLPGFDWYSGCNCFGFHKPRQCYKDSITGKYECWCSDEYGYKISPGKSFTCSEKLTEVMNCF